MSDEAANPLNKRIFAKALAAGAERLEHGAGPPPAFNRRIAAPPFWRFGRAGIAQARSRVYFQRTHAEAGRNRHESQDDPSLLHVLDLEKSLAFYERALGLTVQRRMGPEDGSWENVFVGNGETDFQVELTWNRGRTEPYANGGRDTHLAFEVDDIDAARKLHEEMGCVCFVNERMGIYFIEDPDGCWLEILPADRAE